MIDVVTRFSFRDFFPSGGSRAQPLLGVVLVLRTCIYGRAPSRNPANIPLFVRPFAAKQANDTVYIVREKIPLLNRKSKAT